MEKTLNLKQVGLTLLCLILVYKVGAQLPNDAATLKDVEELKAHYLPAAYAKSNLTLADLQRMLQNKCQKANAAENATALSANIEAAAMKLMDCASGLANITVILDEVERAKPLGDLDLVFEKYCLRLPRAEACLKEFNDALLPCLTREERDHNAVMQRITKKLLEFICYKNGDQIALFIAEKGPECLEQNRDNIGSCLNDTFGGYLPKEFIVEQTQLPDFILGPRQCVDLYQFEQCVLRHLERCETITPSNIVEAMFRYVRKESNCQAAIDRVKARSVAQPLTSGVAWVKWSWSLASLGIMLMIVAR